MSRSVTFYRVFSVLLVAATLLLVYENVKLNKIKVELEAKVCSDTLIESDHLLVAMQEA